MAVPVALELLRRPRITAARGRGEKNRFCNTAARARPGRPAKGGAASEFRGLEQPELVPQPAGVAAGAGISRAGVGRGGSRLPEEPGPGQDGQYVAGASGPAQSLEGSLAQLPGPAQRHRRARRRLTQPLPGAPGRSLPREKSKMIAAKRQNRVAFSPQWLRRGTGCDNMCMPGFAPDASPGQGRQEKKARKQ